ncbi:MAG TPA: hypothetical protein VN832_01720 [Stellaceae bacterium]|nr:hypothetical protein [Stellaceae bacterium]
MNSAQAFDRDDGRNRLQATAPRTAIGRLAVIALLLALAAGNAVVIQYLWPTFDAGTQASITL